MKNNPIGIFDSGIGGLTVAYALKKQLPNESIIYFGDTEHLPYGDKSDESIQDFSERIASFLIKKECKAIVIACNSASSVAYRNVKNIAKNIPVFNVIDPIVQYVAEKYKKGNVGVIGTKTTIKSQAYKKKISLLGSQLNVLSLATPLLVPMIEEGFVSGKISQTIICNYLSDKKLNNINHLILACTHYPLIQDEIEKFYHKSVNVINSSELVVKYVKNTLYKESLLKETKENDYLFYTSNYTVSLEKSAKFFFNEAIKLIELNIHNDS